MVSIESERTKVDSIEEQGTTWQKWLRMPGDFYFFFFFPFCVV